MKSLLLAIILAISPVAVFAADVASVNFKAIQDDLREYYFSKPENAEVKQKFKAAVKDQEKFQAEIQKQVMDGKQQVDFRSMMSKSGGSMERFQLERKIDGDLKKELYLIVSGLGLKYELIYDASDTETIIYAKSPVDDLTTILRQAIIDLGKKK